MSVSLVRPGVCHQGRPLALVDGQVSDNTSVPGSSLSLPSEEYRQRQQAREARVAHFEKMHVRLGNLRLVVVLATLVAVWWWLERGGFSVWWFLLPFFLFVTLAVFHARVLRMRSCAERAVDVYRRGLARIEDRWIGSGQKGERIDLSSSLYATDLDLFGHGSLFELLSRARTRMGEDALANWLLAPSSREEISERHAAIVELRTRLDLREDMAILGEERKGGDLKIGVHPDALTRWAETPNQLASQGLRWFALVLAVMAMVAAVVWGELGVKAPFFVVLVIEGIVLAVLRRPTKEILESTPRALEDIRLLASLLARLDREQFDAPRLQAIKHKLSSHHLLASRAIARLNTIVQCIYSLNNAVMRLLNVPLLYSVQVAYAAEAWRRNHGSAVRDWLGAVGELEALVSLAAYSYEHPADPFPEFVEGEPTFDAVQLGHPLIAAAKCVRNSVSICGETRVLLVSGSNMSGKSTLMRAVGINTVLAMAGAPVRAERMQLTPLRVGASILVNDSLLEGSSRFYAEITRLRNICILAEERPPVLFLLDELLQGTNSRDRLIGAEGVVSALVESGAIGLISTHDLALTNIATVAKGRLRNVHLQDEIVDGKMRFDFLLRDGVVPKSNGIELMRLIGLKV
jgi:MutS domain V/MutS domain III